MLYEFPKQEQFDTLDDNVVLYFSAVWCGPCKTFGSIVEHVSFMYPNVKFVKIDIDDHIDLVHRFNIRGVPSIVILNNNEVAASRTGTMSQSQLSQLVRTTFSLE